MKKFLLSLLLLAFTLTFTLICYADTISMSFSNVPVGYLFQNLGRMYGVSFAVSSVAAAKTVSVELTDVEFDQALKMIASSAGVKITKEQDKLYVVRAIEEETEGVTKEEKARKEQEDRLKGSAMAAVTTKFVNAKDIQLALDKLFGEDFSSLVSFSELTEDDEKRDYSSLMIYASSEEILTKVKEVIKEIDRPKPMIEMEALFIELTINENKDVGANWDVMTNPLKFQEEAPAQNPDNDPLKYYTARFGTFWRISPWESEATLEALAGSGHGRVLANPKVRVMSGRKALFVSETQMPILTKDSEDDINTEWKNVGISLEILPVVLEDGTVYMNVIPKASSIVGEKRLGEVSAPIISERRVETEMLLKPDETIVIGGLINDRDIKNMSKVPILGDIPLFGELFKNTKTEKERSTVIVFLRPRIIEDYMGANIPEKLKEKWEKTTVEIEPVSPKDEILQKSSSDRTDIQKLLEQAKSPQVDQKQPDETQKPAVGSDQKTPETQKPVVIADQKEKPAKTPKSDEEYAEKWKNLINEYSKKQEQEKQDEQNNEQVNSEQKEPAKNNDSPSQGEKSPDKPSQPDKSSDKDNPSQEEKSPEEDGWTPPVK